MDGYCHGITRDTVSSSTLPIVGNVHYCVTGSLGTKGRLGPDPESSYREGRRRAPDKTQMKGGYYARASSASAAVRRSMVYRGDIGPKGNSQNFFGGVFRTLQLSLVTGSSPATAAGQQHLR